MRGNRAGVCLCLSSLWDHASLADAVGLHVLMFTLVLWSTAKNRSPEAGGFMVRSKMRNNYVSFMTTMAPLASLVSLNLWKALPPKDLFPFRLHL